MTAEEEDANNVEDPPPLESNNYDDEKIKFVIYNNNDHWAQSSWITLRSFPFPENVMAFLFVFIVSPCELWGVVAVDSTENNKVAGYFLGTGSFTIGYGSKRKKVAMLNIVCVHDDYQNHRIAKRMGKFIMEGAHPKFKLDDYDEVILQDTDAMNSPSWLFSDRIGFRYFPTHDIIRRYGFVSYLRMIFLGTHILSGQFLKRYVKNEEEKEEADNFEKEKGYLACIVSGLVPVVYWVLVFVIRCGEFGVRGRFIGYQFLSMYLLLIMRFFLAHIYTFKTDYPPPVYREYDFWWIPLSFGWPVSVFAGVPLLGYAGGFYLSEPGINYVKERGRRAMGLLYLPIVLSTLVLFFLHTLFRVYYNTGILNGPAGEFMNVLGYAAFFFSLTDVATPLICFPSGAMAIRRFNLPLFILFWTVWLALLLVSILVVPEEAPPFMELWGDACGPGIR